MIEVTEAPRNREHFFRLMTFAGEVLAVCDEVGVEPIVDGGLAVFAYTRDPTMEVRDVDFGSPESDFSRLQHALHGRGIHCEIKSWHVLQARKDGLKVELGAVEHWNRGIPDHHERMRIAGIEFRMIAVDGLLELYGRGFDATATHGTEPDPAKHRRIAAKLRVLDEYASAHHGGRTDRSGM